MTYIVFGGGDVMKLVKIRMRWMQILTFKIRRMQMQIYFISGKSDEVGM